MAEEQMNGAECDLYAQRALPTKVFVVRGENCFSENGEVAWLVGVAATREKAEEIAEKERQSHRENGKRVCYDEDDDGDWDVDVTIDEAEVER